MDECNYKCSVSHCLASQLSQMTKTLMLDLPGKLFNEIFSYLSCTMDLYHFRPLSVALTLAESHKDRRKQDLSASFSQTVLS